MDLLNSLQFLILDRASTSVNAGLLSCKMGIIILSLLFVAWLYRLITLLGRNNLTGQFIPHSRSAKVL